MNKKGFTLIELLAVIVLLAVVALITVPNVLDIIEESRKGSVSESARGIIRAAENYYMQGVMRGDAPSSIDLTTNTLNYNGDKPEKGLLLYDATGRAHAKMYMNGYCVSVDFDNTVVTEKKDKSDCKVNPVILSINSNGGELTEQSREYDKGDSLGTLPVPTKEGYSFEGWLLPDGTVVTEATEITEIMTITAKWKAKTYTITLSDGVDSTTDKTKVVTYDSTYGELEIPEKGGYRFKGWKLEDGTDITSDSIVNIAENHNIYAQWEEITYTKYIDGTPLLYDPVYNVKCDTVSSSALGTNEGCMKWYVFLDSESSPTIKLLLNHNITETYAWNASNGETPDTINEQLQNKVSSWNDVVKDSVRLISAFEINQIAKTSSNYTWIENDWTTEYYFHTGTQTEYTGDLSSNKYGWLFDNTFTCEQYGCYETTEDFVTGYWTSTPTNDNKAWAIGRGGYMDGRGRTITSYAGARPVIEVSKSVFE